MSVGGAMAQAQGQAQASKAMRRASEAEDSRQSGYQAEGMGYFNTALDRSKKEEQDKLLNDKTDVRKQKYSDVVKDFSQNSDLLQGQQSAPQVVLNTISDKVQGSVEDQRAEGLRKALLDAWGDTNLTNAVANQRSGDKLGMIGRFAQGSAGVLPLELQAAAEKGSGMRSFGSMLQGAGIMAGIGGAMGAGPSWGDIFGSSAGAGIAAPDVVSAGLTSTPTAGSLDPWYKLGTWNTSPGFAY